MKKTALTVILTLCTVLVTLALSVQADTALQLSVAANGGDYKTVESALAAVEEMAKKGELNEKGVRLVLTGNHTATVKNGVLFGQKTIFLPDGKKLPITVTGGTLNLPAENVACANDYTFSHLVIPFDDTATKLFAGSGCITLEQITVNTDSDLEYRSSFFGDTFTAAVFEGWTEENLKLCQENGLFVSSVTLGSGFVYESKSGYPYAAVGSSTDFSAKVGGRTLSAKDTCPKLIIDGANLFNTMARIGSNPVGNSVLWIKSGRIHHLYAAGFDQFSKHSGDITVIAEGGTVQNYIRLVNELTLNGNLSVTLKNLDLTANTQATDGCMIQTLFGTCTIKGDVTVSMENVKADRYYGGMVGSDTTVFGDVSVSAKNCTFSLFYYGGAGKAKIYGNVENTLENVTAGNFKGADECSGLGNATSYTGKKASVGSITNKLKNVNLNSEKSVTATLGNVAGTQTGTITNILDEVTTSANTVLYCGNRSGTVKGISNTVRNSVFGYAFYGGGSGGTVSSLQNDLSNVIFQNYAYLAGGSNTVSGPIENRLTSCTVTKYYIFGGVNGGKVLNSNLEYGTRNYVNGGSFLGFWGGSASTGGTHRGNVYNEVSDGDFYGYDSKKPFAFAGGTRNTRHEGNTMTLIRGGTFHGFVAGGSIPNDESYAKEHTGTANLILAGGTFLDTVDANCRWGSYPNAVLNLDTTHALQPFSFKNPIECNSFLANSETPYPLTGQIRCGDFTVRGKGALQICGEVVCDSLSVEAGAGSLEVYGKLQCGSLDLGAKTLYLGAKSFVSASSVTGEVNLHQKEHWLKQTYFSSPKNTKISLSQQESTLGEAMVKDGVVEGRSPAFAGVGIIFSDKVSLRFAFDKEWVEQTRNEFSFTAKCGNRTIVDNAAFGDLIFKDGYYTVVSSPLNAAELGKTVSVFGSLIPEFSFSLTQLAANGVQIYDKEGTFKTLGELLKAFANFTVAADNYKNGNTNPLPYENKATATGFTATDGFVTLTEKPCVDLVNKQLILDEGMHLRYYLRSAEMKSSEQTSSPVQKLHYFRNSLDISSYATKKWVSTGFQKGYYEITVDLPVYPSQSHEVLRFMVSDKEDLHQALASKTSKPYPSYVHEDYVDRLDAVAETLSQTQGSEELGSALLYYLQAGAKYYADQPDLSTPVYPETFSAGYAREDISPHGFLVNLYSSASSYAVLDPLYTTCLALWDGEELALFFSVDVRQCPEYLTSNSKALLAEEFDVDPNKIFFNATHNHSSPNTTSHTRSDLQKWYNEIFFPKMVMAAKRAVRDLAPATLYTGKAISDPGTNYVRRYLRGDGSYTGIHNIVPSSNIVGYETEADKELRTLRFDRGDKKDILFVNWQGHAAHGAAYDHAATADFIGSLRDGVEKKMDVHFIYCNGASGNLNFTPKLGEKYFSSPYFRPIGTSLAGTVEKAVSAEKAIQSGKIQVTYVPYEGIIRHEDEKTVTKANECATAASAYKAEKGSEPSASWYQTNYGFQSKYEVSAIRTRAGLGESETIPIWAFSFGDVGMSFVPFEQFDTNAQQIRAASPFAVTMTAGYTNGTHSYIPSGFAAPHNGYEVYTCRYAFSTGDEVAAELSEALIQMHGKH